MAWHSFETGSSMCGDCFLPGVLLGIIGFLAGVVNGVTAFGDGLIFMAFFEVAMTLGIAGCEDKGNCDVVNSNITLCPLMSDPFFAEDCCVCGGGAGLGRDLRQGVTAASIAVLSIQVANLISFFREVVRHLPMVLLCSPVASIGVLVGTHSMSLLDVGTVRWVVGLVFAIVALGNITRLVKNYLYPPPPPQHDHPKEVLSSNSDNFLSFASGGNDAQRLQTRPTLGCELAPTFSGMSNGTGPFPTPNPLLLHCTPCPGAGPYSSPSVALSSAGATTSLLTPRSNQQQHSLLFPSRNSQHNSDSEESEENVDLLEPIPLLSCRDGAYQWFLNAIPTNCLSTKQFFVAITVAFLISGFLFGVIAAPGPPVMVLVAVSKMSPDQTRMTFGPLVVGMCTVTFIQHSQEYNFPELIHIGPSVGAMIGFGIGRGVLSHYISGSKVLPMIFVLLLFSGLRNTGAFTLKGPAALPSLIITLGWIAVLAVFTVWKLRYASLTPKNAGSPSEDPRMGYSFAATL